MKISVILTSYNYQDYIADSIKSVLSQTYNDYEFIIIDDCSNDDSVNIIKQFDDKRIKFIINEKNLGLSKTLQKGIDVAKGDWIAFLESDDIWDKNYLEEKIKIAELYPDIGMIFNDVDMFGDEKQIKFLNSAFKYNLNKIKNYNYPKNLFFDICKFNSILTFSSAFVKKENLVNYDLNPPVDKVVDWWLFIHLSRNCKFYYIPEKLTKWRIHKNSYIYKKNKFTTIPVNIYALFDIFKKEKDLRLIFFIIYIIFFTILRKLKTKFSRLFFSGANY